MSYLFGLISIVSFFVLLSVKIDENQKMRSISHLIVRLILWNSIVVIASLAIYVFFIGDSGAGSGYTTIEKKLNITIKDNNPCFYIDSFDEMEAFDIDGIQISKPPMPYERYWGIGSFADKYKRIKIPLKTFAGTEKCVQYGAKNKFFNESSKKLTTDVLYKASMSGIKRNIPYEKVKDGDEIRINVNFYLSKNQNTGEIKAIELSESQVNDWMKKMNEHNKSSETTKEKK